MSSADVAEACRNRGQGFVRSSTASTRAASRSSAGARGAAHRTEGATRSSALSTSSTTGARPEVRSLGIFVEGTTSRARGVGATAAAGERALRRAATRLRDRALVDEDFAYLSTKSTGSLRHKPARPAGHGLDDIVGRTSRAAVPPELAMRLHEQIGEVMATRPRFAARRSTRARPVAGLVRVIFNRARCRRHGAHSRWLDAQHQPGPRPSADVGVN